MNAFKVRETEKIKRVKDKVRLHQSLSVTLNLEQMALS